MELSIYQIDAFTSRLFGGNPAAIVPLESEWLADATLQSIAAENNLAETAYMIRKSDGRYDLRWFTPGREVDLCGHATLASAFVIFRHLEPALETVAFDTRSGELIVTRDGAMLSMDFPSRKPEPCAVDSRLKKALGGKPAHVLGSRDYFVVYESEDEIRALAPDMRELAKMDRFATIVTAPGKSVDFVSRFFAPAAGVDEDPVTGSPLWGELWCEDLGARVKISGHAVEYLRGTIVTG